MFEERQNWKNYRQELFSQTTSPFFYGDGKIIWRCWGSNPGLFTCEANTLPLSYIPPYFKFPHCCSFLPLQILNCPSPWVFSFHPLFHIRYFASSSHSHLNQGLTSALWYLKLLYNLNQFKKVEIILASKTRIYRIVYNSGDWELLSNV